MASLHPRDIASAQGWCELPGLLFTVDTHSDVVLLSYSNGPADQTAIHATKETDSYCFRLAREACRNILA